MANSDLPSPRKIAKRLRKALRERQFHREIPCVLNIGYPAFYRITGRRKIRQPLYAAIETEAIQIGIIVGFGINSVMIGFDRADVMQLEQHT